MVGRIEWALAGLLAAAVAVGVSNQQETLSAQKEKSRARKEVELLNARAQEVNATEVLNDFTARRAVLIDKVWHLEEFVLHNPDILSLSSRRAIRSRASILLEGNVTLRREDGSVYEAERVRYETRRKVLRSVGPFFAHKGEDFVRGEDFLYNLKKKRTLAEKVHARYRLSEWKRQKGK